MRYIKQPRAILIAATETDEDGLCEYLTEVGAHAHTSDCALHDAPAEEPGPHDCGWDLWETNAPSGGERLVEVAGRSCYRSFRSELNPNLSEVREGNGPYIQNIVRSGHGSVLEHASVTFAFVGVSRVFTHELVRHRAGTAFSQESLRYVRLEELMCWYPGAFKEPVLGDLYDKLVSKGLMPNGAPAKAAFIEQRARMLRDTWRDTFERLEETQRQISRYLLLDELPKDFRIKKRITSAMRRLVPIGLGTAIVCTGNHRTWRHVLELRSSPHAEEEMVIVMGCVARQLKRRFPNIYADMEFEDEAVTFGASKI